MKNNHAKFWCPPLESHGAKRITVRSHVTKMISYDVQKIKQYLGRKLAQNEPKIGLTGVD